jgi:hypothetical protein
MQERIEKLESQVKWLGSCALLLAVTVVFLVASAATSGPDNTKVLRARGLVIEDDRGRERILIGAPIPAAKNRVRTDLERVKAIWGKQFGEKYMDWYRDYRNETNGIVILDADGFDRVAVGDPVPDPNIGKRIAPSTGMVINDAQGFERTGYSLLRVDGQDRVVLGFDYPGAGGEGLALALLDGGPVGMTMRNGDRGLYVGTGQGTLMDMPGGEKPFNGLAIREGKEVKYELNFANSKPAQK